jgi:hypothetical protein
LFLPRRNDGTIKPKKMTLLDAYRIKNGDLDSKECKEALFWAALYPQARWLARLKGGYSSDYFEPEKDFLDDVLMVRTMDEYVMAARDYYAHPRNRHWLRRSLRLRISIQRLRVIVRDVLT